MLSNTTTIWKTNIKTKFYTILQKHQFHYENIGVKNTRA